MPNGKKNDHPFSDILIWGTHPFPEDIERLVVEIHRLQPGALEEFENDAFDWEHGYRLDEARERLARKLRELQTERNSRE